MKFLLVIFLAGITLAAAIPHSSINEVEIYDAEEDFLNSFDFADEDEEIARNLRGKLTEILEKIKDAIENRKTLGGNVLTKIRELYRQMREKSIPLGDKVKELVEQMKEKATGAWKRILDRISAGNKRSIRDFETVYADEDQDIAKDMREKFVEILERVKDAFETRTTIGGYHHAKLREIYEFMKKNSMPFGDRVNELLEQLRGKTNGEWKELLDEIRGDDKRSIDDFDMIYAEDITDLQEEREKKLKERFEEILQKLMDIIENGKTVKAGFLKTLNEIRQTLRDMKVDIGDHAKLLIEKLKEKAKGYWKRILDKLYPDKDVTFADEEDEVAKNLKEKFNEILEKIKDAFENRKVIKGEIIAKFQEIWAEMKKRSIPLGDRAKELIEQMKEKANNFWKKILDRISPSKRSAEGFEIVSRSTSAEDLSQQFTNLLEKLREAFRERKFPGRGFVSKLREVREKMRQKNIPISGNIKEMLEKLKEKANGFWKRVLDRLGGNRQYAEADDELTFEVKTSLGQRLKDALNKILKKIDDAIEQRKTVKEDLLEKAKEIGKRLKELKIDIEGQAKDFIENLKEKAKDYWNNILDHLKAD